MIYRLFLLFIICSTQAVFADYSEVLLDESAASTKIKEIKNWVSNNDNQQTCLDDYLKRRKQLSIRMATTPVIIAGSVGAGALVGAPVGYGIYLASGSNAGGFADLAAFLGGGVIGAMTGAGISSVGTSISYVNFFKNRRLLKIIFEARTSAGSEFESFYNEYEKLAGESCMTIQEVQNLVTDLDFDGKLCNGDLVSPKRFRKGKKLKQRLTTKEELFKFLIEFKSAQN